MRSTLERRTGWFGRQAYAQETMLTFCTDAFPLPLPSGHRFPLEKYALLRRRVAEEGIVAPDDLQIPASAPYEDLARVHTGKYLTRVSTGTLSAREQRGIGFPWSPEMVERSRRSVGATLAAGRTALERGVAVSLAGGTHHAFPSRGSGYCVFNDVAVAARTLQAEGRVRRVIILDCDVHQGDGTAAIFAGDDTVFTFSIHGANNFPFRKQASDLDLALRDETGDQEYLEALEGGLRQAISKHGADLAIYLAGADPFEGDMLGRLALTKPGLAERDRLVFDACRRAGLPVAVTMAGGYGRRVQDTVDIHVETVRAASEHASH